MPSDGLNRELMALLEGIEAKAAAHPRGLQKRIGPSELGACPRYVAMLLADRKPFEKPAWRSTVGVAVHAWLAGAVELMPGWLSETRVPVGEVDGVMIDGSADAFNCDSGTVVDFKVVGTTTLGKAARKGPSMQYRVQGHCYGLGFANLGYQVRSVAVCFLPAAGALGDLVWCDEPWQPLIAHAALARTRMLSAKLAAEGLPAILASYPLCDLRYCMACKPERLKGIDPSEWLGLTA